MNDRPISRRSVTRGLLAVWAAASAGGLRALADEVAVQPMAAPKFFSAGEMAFVTAYADTLIPDTDTPGAAKVGVPALFDRMMATWAGAQTRAELRKLLSELQADLARVAGRSFVGASADVRQRALLEVDARRFAAEPARPGPYRQMKILVAKIYYSTKVGATVELRYEPIPGDWKSDIAFADVGRSWAR